MVIIAVDIYGYYRICQLAALWTHNAAHGDNHTLMEFNLILMKSYRTEKPKLRLAYPPALSDYLGQRVNLTPAIPVGKPLVAGKLTRRRESYYVGNVSVCPGEGHT